MSTWTVLKDLVKKNYLIQNVLKDGTTSNSGQKLDDGHISNEDYLTCKKMTCKKYG